MVKKFLCALFLTLFMDQMTVCLGAANDTFSMNSRQSFYSYENKFEMILHIPPSFSSTSLNITLKLGDKLLAKWNGVAGKTILRIPFESHLSPSDYIVTAEIVTASGSRHNAGAGLKILACRNNEVKTDRLTGGLIVNKRMFFPFGFYCYFPVRQTLPEEEVVKGFNMISPYQKIIPGTLEERRSYMDRCAELGMKVHYNLLSFSGAGTASEVLNGISEEKKKELLVSEIRAFMNHPALLAWFIADEPNGYKTPPEQLEEVYRIISETDPWHPVSIVFMAPFLSSKKYSGAMDIVIADPYPVPSRSVTLVGDATNQLKKEFYGKKPVWIVPQAFGGSEWWSREPSLQEIRSMTYQAIVRGATGIQYFIRHGLNSFPKSTVMWNECGRMAVEIAEITPWLLSDETFMPVSVDSKNILISSSIHDGKLMIIVVNTINSPAKALIRINGVSGGTVNVLFENRSVALSNGTFSDYLSAYGSQVYMVNTATQRNTIPPYRGNLITDPGFEDTSSPGVPSSCYSWNEGDSGSTYFTDTREHYEGDHSIRLITPSENGGTRLRFFPIKVTKGKKYMLSIWAKADPDSSKLKNGEKRFPDFELSLGDFGKKRFTLQNEWQQFVTSVTIPADSIPSPRVNVLLRMPGKGVGWFDMLQVFEAVDVIKSINPELSVENAYEN